VIFSCAPGLTEVCLTHPKPSSLSALGSVIQNSKNQAGKLRPSIERADNFMPTERLRLSDSRALHWALVISKLSYSAAIDLGRFKEAQNPSSFGVLAHHSLAECTHLSRRSEPRFAPPDPPVLTSPELNFAFSVRPLNVPPFLLGR